MESNSHEHAYLYKPTMDRRLTTVEIQLDNLKDILWALEILIAEFK